MAISRTLALTLVAVALVLAGSRWSAGSISGNRAWFTGYTATVGDVRAPQYRFEVDLEPTAFRLALVNAKYRLVRVRVQNYTPQPIAFSADHDVFNAIRTRSSAALTEVPGRLNMQSSDAAFWDALTPDTRVTLAYPVSLNGTPAGAAGGPPASPETLDLFVFFDATALTDLPDSFEYSIASLALNVTLTKPAAKAND